MMKVKVGYYNVFRDGQAEINQHTAQKIAERAGMTALPNVLDIPAGTKVFLNDFWRGNRGWGNFVETIEEMATANKAVVQHPGSRIHRKKVGDPSPESYFIIR